MVSRTGAALFVIAWMSIAQSPPAFVRGDFVDSKNEDDAGSFRIRTGEGQVYTCTFDQRTWFERNKLRVSAAALEAGDHLEVVSDRSKNSPGGCYARTVHVVEIVTPVRSRLRPYQSVTDHIAPRGDLSYAGVVIAVNSSRMEIRPRNQAAPVVLNLRPDTRYIQEGIQVEAGQLKRNTRVFVRAGKDLEGEIEAYQVSWGEILTPVKP
jgi:hypothetical protein